MWILWPIIVCAVGILHAVLPAGGPMEEPADEAAPAPGGSRVGVVVFASAVALLAAGIVVVTGIVAAS